MISTQRLPLINSSSHIISSLQKQFIFSRSTGTEHKGGSTATKHKKMASLGVVMGVGVGVGVSSSSNRRLGFMTTTRRSATGRSGGGGSVVEEKGPFDWILGAMQKDQLVETDPVLQKVEGKSSRGRVGGGGTTSVSVPTNGKKKFPGFGGLFAKN